jgi:hypothetical protein
LAVPPVVDVSTGDEAVTTSVSKAIVPTTSVIPPTGNVITSTGNLITSTGNVIAPTNTRKAKSKKLEKSQISLNNFTDRIEHSASITKANGVAIETSSILDVNIITTAVNLTTTDSISRAKETSRDEQDDKTSRRNRSRRRN